MALVGLEIEEFETYELPHGSVSRWESGGAQDDEWEGVLITARKG